VTELLKDIRVLDMSRVLAGPLCGMTLGDLGADVIKVERPGLGDESRQWGPPFDARGESAYYLSTNRNKLGIALDLEVPDDVAALNELIAGADVVLENFKPETLSKAQLDRDELLEAHPHLIWLTLTGFGLDNTRLGYDLVVQAESGWMAITGDPTGEPMKVGVALADVIAGKDAALSIMAALVARERSREALPVSARRLHVSLAHSAIAALVNVAQNVLVSGSEARRFGNAHPNLVPYQAFKARDGYIVIGVGNDRQWTSCCFALELPELAEDKQLAANKGRLASRERVTGVIARRVAERDGQEWLTRLSKAGVPAGRVRAVSEALGDVAHSALTGIAPSVPGKIRYAPPKLDEHGTEIRRLGWQVFDAR
jgi:glutaryl-CoA transferase